MVSVDQELLEEQKTGVHPDQMQDVQSEAKESGRENTIAGPGPEAPEAVEGNRQGGKVSRPVRLAGQEEGCKKKDAKPEPIVPTQVGIPGQERKKNGVFDVGDNAST